MGLINEANWTFNGFSEKNSFSKTEPYKSKTNTSVATGDHPAGVNIYEFDILLHPLMEAKL